MNFSRSSLLSCLITIFACTWTVLHLNVPGLQDGPWTIAMRKAKWMAINILIPEFIFSKAICDLRLALNDLRLAWTDKNGDIQHTYSWQVDYGPRANLLYRILGLQLPIRGDRLAETTAEYENNNPTRAKRIHTYRTTQNWTLTHAYFANMGGLLYPDIHGVRENELRYYVLSGVTLSNRYDWSGNHPLEGLVLEKRDIEDKSKADWLLKCFTVLQVAWLVLTVIVRGVEGLPVTQLEIATVAFSIFAIFTYAANWWKPKDVSRPILIKKRARGGFTLRLTNLTKAEKGTYKINEEDRVRNDVTRMEEGVPLIFSIIEVSSFVFGGLHLIAWNFEASGLTSAILPLISLDLNLYLNYLATTYTNNQMSKTPHRERGMIYIAARLILLVLLLTSLRAVPKGVYEDTPWTRFLPNFS
ncbi:hypothetical protein F5B18DRAFT_663121 [Nemania serpens]|nr:hypothetical protein F5B18DRAFT_663121 [Nemania serpens]